MRKMNKLFAVTVVIGLLWGQGAFAADFSPTIKFKLSPAKVKKLTQITVNVAQNDNEEELAHVTLRIPAGFSLPSDRSIAGCTVAPNGSCQGGDTLGEGSINIHAGPGCHPSAPASAPTTQLSGIPAVLKERDRTDEESDAGIKAVWVLEISGVTRVPLEVTGSAARGWKLDGDIARNDGTCPPFSFSLKILKKSAQGKPMIKTPSKAGRYTFSATFTSQDSPATKTLRQTVKITR